MNKHLSSTRSTDPDLEEGMGAAFWVCVLASATIICLLGWAAYLSMTTFGFGVLCGAAGVGLMWLAWGVYAHLEFHRMHSRPEDE